MMLVHATSEAVVMQIFRYYIQFCMYYSQLPKFHQLIVEQSRRSWTDVSSDRKDDLISDFAVSLMLLLFTRFFMSLSLVVLREGHETRRCSILPGTLLEQS